MQLKYHLQVLKEVLRFYPVLTSLNRVVTADTSIGPFAVEKGLILNINLMALHMNPDLWHDPDTFDPDRFSPENEPKMSVSLEPSIVRPALPFSSAARVARTFPLALGSGSAWGASSRCWWAAFTWQGSCSSTRCDACRGPAGQDFSVAARQGEGS